MKKLFRIYNRLTDLSDHEYKFMVENESPYIDKARKILVLLEEQHIHLERLDFDDPDTGNSYYLDKNATVYDPVSEDDISKRRGEIKYENNYADPDVFVIAKILQELDTGEEHAQSKS